MSARNLILFAALCAWALAGCNCGEVPLDGLEDTGGSVAVGDTGPRDGAVLTGDGGILLDDAGNPIEPDGGETTGDGREVAGDGGEPADAACPPMTCDGLCGPVRDFCTGKVLQCGGCSGGLVCELDTHVCMVPARDCTALGAECGAVRNTCGERLNCGDCKDPTKECDRNTHRCVACTNPTCQDLGYQCGQVWLGCGPFSNLTDCGACADGLTCNSAYHVCEPPCTPPADADVCAAVGAECGFVSNGCGGLSDCGGCQGEEKCGARGIGNRCDLPELPNECVAANRECGTLSSACGLALDCGTCADPSHICTAAGRCEPPCKPATCDTTYAGTCGLGLPERCEAGKTIDCPCPAGSGQVCTTSAPGTTGSCVVPSGCDAFGASGAPGQKCSNGASPAFPLGDGTNLACPCAGGAVCVKDAQVVVGEATGNCCLNGNSCPPNACNRSVKDTCTGADIPCACQTAGTHCNAAASVCEQDHACANYNANGAAGDDCSNAASASFPKNDSENLACPCSAGNCYSAGAVATGATRGSCCVPATCPSNSCVKVHDPCTNTDVNCSCTAGNYCKASACSPFETCATYGATGADKKPCSIGQDFTDFPRGDGSGLACPCNSGGLCNKPGVPQMADPGTKGECCFNSVACGASECNVTKTNTCTGADIVCRCTAALTHCNNISNTCEADNSCTTWTHGLAGEACSNGPSTRFDTGNGTKLTCPCTQAGAQCFAAVPGNVLPNGDAREGQCCVPDTCSANSCGVITDHCSGQQIQCACTAAGTHCNTANNLCETNLTCAASYGATGASGSVCSNGGAFTNGASPPTLLSCPCGGGGLVCSNGAAVVSGTGCGTVSSTVCNGDVDCTGPGQKCIGKRCSVPCQTGTCCLNTVTCGNRCNNTTLRNSCTGELLTCACGAGYYCDAAQDGTCQPNNTCATYGANGQNGNPCTTNPSTNPAWTQYPGGPAMGCPCGGTRVCSVAGSPPHTAGSGEVGACCTNTATCSGKCSNTLILNTCTGLPLTCNCNSGFYCDAAQDGTCQANFTCSAYTTGAVGTRCSNGNDPAFQRTPTDTVGQTCRCAAGNCYKSNAVVSGATEGTCCTPPPVPAGNLGDSCLPVADPCTGTNLNVTCKAGSYCDAGSGKCTANRTCAYYTANGAPGQVCSNGADAADFPVSPGSSTGLTCRCSAGNCYENFTPVTGANGGLCCTPPTIPAGNVGDACGPIWDACTGVNIARNCAAGNYCKNGTCAVYETCASSYGANGTFGAPCTTSPNASWPRGDNTNLICGCLAGMSCSVDPDGAGGSPGHLAAAGEVGACCAPYPVPPGNVGDDCTPIIDPCTGNSLERRCKGVNYCNASGKCEALETCASYNASGAQGASCSDTATYAKGDGTFFACPCSTAAPYPRAACLSGTCGCTKLVPANCGDDGKSDGCNGTMVSTCASPQICYSSACCTPPVCQTGAPGEACGNLSACGQSASCACATTIGGKNYSHNTCNAGTNKCVCTPYVGSGSVGDCATLGPGVHNDGCGSTITCGG
ncbi:MAG TPA: hypothetical protein VGK67_00935 [Myxococcales bacterium]|jgi:hypothetical protein